MTRRPRRTHGAAFKARVALDRQGVYRTALAKREVRGSVSEGVWIDGRGPAGTGNLCRRHQNLSGRTPNEVYWAKLAHEIAA